MNAFRVICISLSLLSALFGVQDITYAEEAQSGIELQSSVAIRDFVPSQGMCRAGRPINISAIIENTGNPEAGLKARLVVPDGIRIINSNLDADSTFFLNSTPSRWLTWSVEAESPGQYKLVLEVRSGDKVINTGSLDLTFFEPQPISKQKYIPNPEPVKTLMLIGAHNCPLWEHDRPLMWSQIRKHPERTPALGFYAQENPEVADWETKWAVEHGVSFFIYCWYRASQGEPVKMNFSSAIHEGFMKSKFVDKMKFTIMWENQSRGIAGVSDEKDLLTNLLPFWIDNYFKHPSYLKVDNKPVLFIYRPENLIEDLGGIENVPKAFDRMRQVCKDSGFEGLYILGEYRGTDASYLQKLKSLGLDYTFAYCWYVPDNPTPEQAVKTQMSYIEKTQELGVLPQVVTVSQAWSGWSDEGTIWKIPPTQFEGLLKQAKDFTSKLPKNELGSKMLILDNWNEWGEGHYIAPYREYGFGYLDAVRNVFSDAPRKHADLIPEDIGMGPYDSAYRTYQQMEFNERQVAAKYVVKPGSEERGLVAWWSFDATDVPQVVMDYSGHRLGGMLRNGSTTTGMDADALKCDGGCVVVQADPRLCPTNAMTIECWVKTDTADQNDKWIVNRITGGMESGGYRLGLVKGRPCIAIPQTAWSHHLTASEALPLGRWVHLAATYDGKIIRIYIDGRECGSLERSGSVNPTNSNLFLGSFAEDHSAHFTGLLDEVKLYDRALSDEELRAHVDRYLVN